MVEFAGKGENMNKNVEQYADQCAVFKMANKTVKKTLSAAAHLQKVNEKNEGDSALPLDVFGSFSRIQLTLIEKSADSLKTPTCNLTVAEVNYIAKRTELAMQMDIEKMFKQPASTTDDGKTSPAYTVKFAMGKLKGKTPAEVADKDSLLSQREFLAENLSKYPANQAIIDGIDDAIRLIEAGSLDSKKVDASATVAPAFCIYEAGNKTRSSVKDEKGNVLVTEIKVNYDASRNYPIEVILHNCYAPLKKDSSDRQNIELSQAVNHETASVNMSMFDFFTFINDCKRTCDLFAEKNAGNAFQLMEKYVWKPDASKGSSEESKAEQPVQPEAQKQEQQPAPAKPSEETKVFVFHTKGEVIEEGDNFTVAVAIDGFKNIGKLLMDKQVANNQAWWPDFVKKAGSDGVKNFKAMATRKGGEFTYISIAK